MYSGDGCNKLATHHQKQEYGYFGQWSSRDCHGTVVNMALILPPHTDRSFAKDFHHLKL